MGEGRVKVDCAFRYDHECGFTDDCPFAGITKWPVEEWQAEADWNGAPEDCASFLMHCDEVDAEVEIYRGPLPDDQCISIWEN